MSNLRHAALAMWRVQTRMMPSRGSAPQELQEEREREMARAEERARLEVARRKYCRAIWRQERRSCERGRLRRTEQRLPICREERRSAELARCGARHDIAGRGRQAAVTISHHMSCQHTNSCACAAERAKQRWQQAVSAAPGEIVRAVRCGQRVRAAGEAESAGNAGRRQESAAAAEGGASAQARSGGVEAQA